MVFAAGIHAQMPKEEAENIRKTLLDLDVTLHQIDFPRKPYHPILLVKSYKQLKKAIFIKKERIGIVK